MLGERSKGDRAFNIDPPTPSYPPPSCGGHAPTAERTVGPGKDDVESLTLRPGIREQHRSIATRAVNGHMATL